MLLLPAGKTLPLVKLPRPTLKKAAPEDVLHLIEMSRVFESARPSDRKSDDDPSNLYATIQKNGTTIASLYIGGSMVTPTTSPCGQPLAGWSGITLADGIRRCSPCTRDRGLHEDVQARNAARAGGEPVHRAVAGHSV